MGYFDKKFNALEKDRESLNNGRSKRNEAANLAFIGDELAEWNPNKTVQTIIEGGGIEKISLDNIKPRSVNDFKNISNETLKKSIIKLGLINPVVVRKSDNGKYIIISGHRRFETYKEILSDLKIKKIDYQKKNADTSKLDKLIEQFLTIPAIVFTVVDKDSELLGTDSKYITKEQEEEMYEAANLENRQISKEDLTKHIMYFYNMIKNDPSYKQHLLEENNENAERKATKLNIPKAIANIITNDLGFNVSSSSVWRLVSIIERESEYPKYYKIAMRRIDDGEPIGPVFKDFEMAIKIHNGEFEKEEKQEYHDRLEKGDEKVVDVYNEAFNIKQAETVAKKDINKYVLKLLNDIKSGSLSVDDAINNFNEYVKR